MAATIILDGKHNEISAGCTIESAVVSLGKHSDAFLYLINGTPVPMDTPIEDGMTVKCLKVASGG
jgi:sulfur carrier protein